MAPTFAIPALRGHERVRGVEHVTYSWLNDHVNRVFKKAGLPNAYAYLFRAYVNTKLVQDGVSPEIRNQIMGQSKPLPENYFIPVAGPASEAARRLGRKSNPV